MTDDLPFRIVRINGTDEVLARAMNLLIARGASPGIATSRLVDHDGTKPTDQSFTQRPLPAGQIRPADCQFYRSLANRDILNEAIVEVVHVCWRDDCQDTPIGNPTKPENPAVACALKCANVSDTLCLRLRPESSDEATMFGEIAKISREIATQPVPRIVVTDALETALQCKREDINVGVAYASWLGEYCGMVMNAPKGFEINGREVNWMRVN